MPPFLLVSKVICSLTKGLSGQATSWPILDLTCLKSAEWAGTESCQPLFSTDPDIFDFMWFGLYSLGEENAWQHWPLKASSANPCCVLGSGKDSAGTAGKFVSAVQRGAVDLKAVACCLFGLCGRGRCRSHLQLSVYQSNESWEVRRPWQ